MTDEHPEYKKKPATVGSNQLQINYKVSEINMGNIQCIFHLTTVCVLAHSTVPVQGTRPHTFIN